MALSINDLYRQTGGRENFYKPQPQVAATAPGPAPAQQPQDDPFYAARLAVQAHPESNPGGGVEQQFRNIWAAHPDKSNESLALLAKQFGLQTMGDVVVMPDGRKIDAVMDERGRNGGGWIDQSAAGGVSRGSTGAGRSGSGGGGRVTYNTSQTTSPVNSEVGNAARAALLKLLKTDPSNVSIDEPALQAQNVAYRNEQDRVRQMRRAAEAESLATQGLSSSGALDQAVASGYNDMGLNTAGFAAKLVGDELIRRREALMQAMQMGLSDANTAEGRALQKELADIDNQLRRYQIDTQNTQFNNDLGFRMGAFEADNERRALEFLMNQGL